MSHITEDSQRDINKEISECMERNATNNYIPVYFDEGDLMEFRHEKEYTCGPSERISSSQDRCPKCGKVFTY